MAFGILLFMPNCDPFCILYNITNTFQLVPLWNLNIFIIIKVESLSDECHWTTYTIFFKKNCLQASLEASHNTFFPTIISIRLHIFLCKSHWLPDIASTCPVQPAIAHSFTVFTKMLLEFHCIATWKIFAYNELCKIQDWIHNKAYSIQKQTQ